MSITYPLYVDARMTAGLAASLGSPDADIHRLLEQLDGQIRDASTGADAAGFATGTLVRLSGRVRRSPLADIVDVVDHLMGGMTNPAEYAVPQDTREVADALRKQLDGSPILEALLTTDGGLTAVVALRRDSVSSATLDELRFGEVTLVGKVSQVVAPEEQWSLTSRSFLTHVLDGAIADLATGLSAFANRTGYPLGTKLNGPALLVHPLAIVV